MSGTYDADALTIVGAAFTIVTDWHVVVLECQCEAKTILRLTVPGQPLACPACRRAFALLDEADVHVAQVVAGRPGPTV